MLRNWITQLGYTAGRWAGDEPLSKKEREKFIRQIGNYFGWNPPSDMSWVVEVTKDNDGKYIVAFMRYTTDEEAERMLGKNYEKANNSVCVVNDCKIPMVKESDMNDIDYTRILQPQEDGYDIQVFQEIKKNHGYAPFDYPTSMVKFHGKVAVLPTDEEQYKLINRIDWSHLSNYFQSIWPLGYNCFQNLVDAYVPDFDQSDNISGQHDGSNFGHNGAWGIVSTLDYHTPAATFVNLMHELMHWKLVALGFGNKANVFFPTTQEFILNHESELCWSIVNSYADTAQAAVGNKPTNRPVSASIHAYLSFLAVAHTYINVLKIEPNHEAAIYKSNLWGSRFNKCLDEIWKVGKFTDKGTRLMLGISTWTSDFFYEARQMGYKF